MAGVLILALIRVGPPQLVPLNLQVETAKILILSQAKTEAVVATTTTTVVALLALAAVVVMGIPTTKCKL